MSETVSVTAFLKNFSYIAAFFATVEWLGFNPVAMSALGTLMILDVFTGVMRSITVDGGPSFKSALLTRGIMAKCLLIIVLAGMGVAAKGMGLSLEMFGQGIVSVLILSELYSIVGNVHSIKSKEIKVEFDAVKYLLDRIKDVMDKVIKK